MSTRYITGLNSLISGGGDAYDRFNYFCHEANGYGSGGDFINKATWNPAYVFFGPDGNDSTGDGTKGNPFLTFTECINWGVDQGYLASGTVTTPTTHPALGTGGLVIAALPGVTKEYCFTRLTPGSLDKRFSGVVGNPVLLVSWDGWGRAIVAPKKLASAPLDSEGSRDMGVVGMAFHGSTAASNDSSGLKLVGRGDPKTVGYGDSSYNLVSAFNIVKGWSTDVHKFAQVDGCSAFGNYIWGRAYQENADNVNMINGRFLHNTLAAEVFGNGYTNKLHSHHVEIGGVLFLGRTPLDAVWPAGGKGAVDADYDAVDATWFTRNPKDTKFYDCYVGTNAPRLVSILSGSDGVVENIWLAGNPDIDDGVEIVRDWGWMLSTDPNDTPPDNWTLTNVKLSGAASSVGIEEEVTPTNVTLTNVSSSVDLTSIYNPATQELSDVYGHAPLMDTVYLPFINALRTDYGDAALTSVRGI